MPTSTPSRPTTERTPRPISEIARDLGLGPEEWMPYGRDKDKVHGDALAARRDRPDGKLVVVSSITPTPAGDGKTTMTIGLGQALWRIGSRPVIALREPSIGPTLGMKGGGTGGGRAQVVPMDDINLHFTGAFHAITPAPHPPAATPATRSASTRARSHGSGSSTSTTARCATWWWASAGEWTGCRARRASSSPRPPRSWRPYAWPRT